MTLISVRSIGISILWLCFLLAVITMLPISPYPQLDGVARFDTAMTCSQPVTDCAVSPDAQAVSLPYFAELERTADIESKTFFLSFNSLPNSVAPTAVFLPKFSDALDLKINGMLITPDRSNKIGLFHHWHRPYFASIPQTSLKQGRNQLEIRLRAHGFSSLSLFPVYVGDAAVLDFAFQIRQILRIGAVRINFGLILLTSAALFVFWLTRPKDSMYFWLAGAHLFASLYCFHWVMPNVMENYVAWTRLWNLSIPLFIWFLIAFWMAWLDFPNKFLRWLTGSATAALSVAILLVPAPYLFTTLNVTLSICFLMGLICLSLIFEYRHKQSRLNFVVMFGLMSATQAFGISEWIYSRVDPVWFPVQFGHLIPVTLFMMLLWIVMFQLANSLQRYEILTETQTREIQIKTQELERSYQELSERTKQQAIDDERHRIMMDLHDGVGGQLVNALAYMSSTGNTDEVLKLALESSLVDMGLMIDSLQITGDIPSLLGILRSRIEPLLERHQMAFRWQIEDDPQLQDVGPSSNLNLLRIVQEAITNSVKHSRASTVTVIATHGRISILDDGIGFDLKTVSTGKDSSRGMGLRSMKKRAADINIDLNIQSSVTGTDVTLSWAI